MWMYVDVYVCVDMCVRDIYIGLCICWYRHVEDVLLLKVSFLICMTFYILNVQLFFF